MTRLGWYELLIYLMVVFTVTAIATVVAFAVSAEEPTVSDPWLWVDELYVTPNAYGPGIDMDATGAPIIWEVYQPNSRVRERIAPNIPVQPDAYGLGVGMDVYGRPVKRGRR